MQSPSFVIAKWCLDISIMSQNTFMCMFTTEFNEFNNRRSQNSGDMCPQNIIQQIMLQDQSKPLSSNTNWLTGPAFLYEQHKNSAEQQEIFSLVDPDSDKEIWPQVTCCASKKEEKKLTPQRVEKFSSWNSLQRAVATLIHIAHSFQSMTKAPMNAKDGISVQCHILSVNCPRQGVLLFALCRQLVSLRS